MQFKLYISMDNDATKTKADIASILKKISCEVEQNEFKHILDLNGNTVGAYGFVGELVETL
jgi:hypothetical protein